MSAFVTSIAWRILNIYLRPTTASIKLYDTPNISENSLFRV